MVDFPKVKDFRSWEISPLLCWSQGKMLLWAYILFLTVSLFKRYHFTANYIFWGVLLPILVVNFGPSAWRSIRRSPITLCETFQRVPLIPFAAAIYLTMLTAASILSIDKDVLNSTAIAQTVIFISLTALLAFYATDFIPRALVIISIIASAYMIGQIYIFLLNAPVLQNISDYRLGYTATDRPIWEISAIGGVFFVAAIASLFEEPYRFWYRIILAGSALSLLVGVIFAQSRGMVIGIVAGTIVVGTATDRGRSARSIRLAATAFAIIVGVSLYTTPDIIQILTSRGGSHRLEIWRHYLDLAAERPWLGYGTTKKISFIAQDGLFIPHPHNLILSAQVRGGVLATGAMISMLLLALYYSARYAKLTGHAAPLGIMVTLIVAGAFDYDIIPRRFPDWQTIFFWFPIGICIATELYVRRHSKGPLPENSCPEKESGEVIIG